MKKVIAELLMELYLDDMTRNNLNWEQYGVNFRLDCSMAS